MALLYWFGAVLVGLIIGLVRGGSLGALAEIKFRGAGVLAALIVIDSFLLPLAARLVPALESILPAAPLILYAGIAAVLLFNWRALRPLPIWMAGFTLNAAFVLANGGYTLFVRPAAFASSGSFIALPAWVSLPWLSAWIPIPSGLLVSPGDVLLAVALAATIQAAMHRREPAPALSA